MVYHRGLADLNEEELASLPIAWHYNSERKQVPFAYLIDGLIVFVKPQVVELPPPAYHTVNPYQPLSNHIDTKR